MDIYEVIQLYQANRVTFLQNYSYSKNNCQSQKCEGRVPALALEAEEKHGSEGKEISGNAAIAQMKERLLLRKRLPCL